MQDKPDGTGAMAGGDDAATLRHFLAAIAAGERAMARDSLTAGAELIWVGTHLRGASPILDWILSDKSPGVYRAGLWDMPQVSPEGLLVRGRVSDGESLSAARVADRIGGILVVEMAAGRIAHIGHQPVGAGRPAATPLHLTARMRGAIDGALTAGRPLQIAHVEGDRPVISTRGSVSCLDGRTLGFWLRDRNGGFANAVARNPHVALVYSDLAVRVNLIMRGRARLTESPDLRTRVFTAAHPREQEHDHLRIGAAVIIDLDAVDGICANDPELSTDGVNMRRTG